MAIFNFPRTPQQRIDRIRFTCSCCNEEKRGLMDLAKILPDPILVVPEAEREGRARISSDLCSLDDEHFFVRAVLEVPIRKTKERLGFGVWGSLAKQNFQIYVDEFDNPEPKFGPFFSWLCSSLPPYPTTMEGSLRSTMEFRGNNQRPLIRLEPSDDPLSIDQQEGITVDRLLEIYTAWGHVVEA